MGSIVLFAAALKVLAIGNSFSASLLDDFGEVAKAAGVELDFAACTIGGSSIERHVREMRIADTNAAYFGCWGGWSYASEGYPKVPSSWKNVVRGDGKNFNEIDALKADTWDIVTIQQASFLSWDAKTYEPWTSWLIDRIRQYAPAAEIMIQQTWSYNTRAEEYAKWKFSQDEFFSRIASNCLCVARNHGNMRVIPTGAAVQALRRSLGAYDPDLDVCGAQAERDGKPFYDAVHLNRDGRYLQACVWTAKIFGVDVTDLPYVPEHLKDNPERARQLRLAAMAAFKTDYEPCGRSFPNKIPEGDFVWDDPDTSLYGGTLYRMLYDGRFIGWGKLCDFREGVYLPECVTDRSKLRIEKFVPRRLDEKKSMWYTQTWEPRAPYLCGDFGDPAATPVEGLEPGFHGRVAAVERITAANARGIEGDRTWRARAWRNERVNGQFVVWGDRAVPGMTAKVSALRTADGATLPATAVRTRYVRYVCTHQEYHNDDNGFRATDDHLVGDVLDPREAVDLPAKGYRPIWVTVDVPADAAPGLYRGELTIAGEGGSLTFPLELTIIGRTLPAPKDWTFFLDLWQMPWKIAQYHHVEEFSKEHYALMEPHFRILGDCGQKTITTQIIDYYWGGKTEGSPRTMIGYRRWRDGRTAFDFTRFDEFVDFAQRCGLGPQIHCYAFINFGDAPGYWYVDGDTGEEVRVNARTGDPAYEAYWAPLLTALEKHAKEKGWLGDLYINFDEIHPEIVAKALPLLKKYAPGLKTASAGCFNPSEFRSLDLDVFSQGLSQGKGNRVFSPDFLKDVAARRAEGKVTTFYVCMFPLKPNLLIENTLAEVRWLGLYAASAGFDGLLRWSVHMWGRDPLYDVSAEPYCGFEPGDRVLVYPGPRMSVRMEALRDSIEDFEKIRVLKKSGAFTERMAQALSAIDHRSVLKDRADVTAAKVAAVAAALNE